MSAWPRESILAALAGAKTRGEIPAADGVVIDTRRITSGDMFLAFRGEHVDGHDYLDHAAQQGAVFAVVEEFQDHPLPQIRVPIMRDALWQLARYARRQHSKTRFIAITGSVGKTSTRSLMRQGFSAAHAVYASQGNFNNNLGMPLCLAQVGCTMRWDVAIFELGMNAPGEIAPLSQLLQPDIVLILNVYAVHQANFPNLEAIAAAKAEICTGLQSEGIALIPNQPEFRAVFDATLPPNVHVRVYNAPQGRFTWRENSLHDQGKMLLDDDTGKFTRYHDNLLAVCAAYTVFASDVESMIAALGNWQPEPGRGAQSLVQLGLGGQITVIDDSYNASLPSMLACLEDLACTTGGRKIAVLGDMKELGSLTLPTHQQLIMHLNHYSFDAVFVVGEVFVALSSEIDRLIHAADRAEEIFALLVAYLKAGDVVAFKASRSVGLDRVVRSLSNPQLQELRPC